MKKYLIADEEFRKKGKRAQILIASTYSKLLDLLPPESPQSSYELQMQKRFSDNLASPDIKRRSSNLSDLEIGNISQFSSIES